jgi:hypothetical protein
MGIIAIIKHAFFGVDRVEDQRSGKILALGHHANLVGKRVPVRGSIRLIPRDQWAEYEVPMGTAPGLCPVRVKNQNGYGACNAHSACSGLEASRWRSGLKHFPFDPWWSYAILCGGWDRGSYIEDAIKLLLERGVPPEGTMPYGTYNPNRIPSSSYDISGRYKAEIGVTTTDFDEVCSACQQGMFGNISMRAGSGFTNLDADGVCGIHAGIGNHAVCYGWGMKKCTRGPHRGKWASKILNSHGTDYGLGGFFWMVEDHFEYQQYISGYSISAPVDGPDDPSPIVTDGQRSLWF